MKKRVLGPILLFAVVGALTTATPASADHHLVVVSEVFMGAPGNLNAQFVEITSLSSGQGFMNGHSVNIYDADGDEVATTTFTNDVVSFPAGGSFLAATTQAETLVGLQADAEFTAASNLSAGGAACFESSSQGLIDCVSWGTFSNGNDLPSNEEGLPFNPNEGIPLGGSIVREEGGGELPVDTGNSRNDMTFGSVRPRNSSGQNGNDLPRITLAADSIGVEETSGSVLVEVNQSMGDAPDDYTIDYSTDPLTATEGDATSGDYENAEGTVTFDSATGEISETFELGINDDATFEGSETLRLKVRNPTGGAVLGSRINATVVIQDPEDDVNPPSSRITRPAHRQAYKASKLDQVKGTADDGAGDVNTVQVGIRQTLKSGSCKWFNGDRFVRRACTSKKFVSAEMTGLETWSYELGGPLPKSRGTKVKFYTAYSRAKDQANLVEQAFNRGRNANKFEIK